MPSSVIPENWNYSWNHFWIFNHTSTVEQSTYPSVWNGNSVTFEIPKPLILEIQHYCHPPTLNGRKFSKGCHHISSYCAVDLWSSFESKRTLEIFGGKRHVYKLWGSDQAENPEIASPWYVNPKLILFRRKLLTARFMRWILVKTCSLCFRLLKYSVANSSKEVNDFCTKVIPKIVLHFFSIVGLYLGIVNITWFK